MVGTLVSFLCEQFYLPLSQLKINQACFPHPDGWQVSPGLQLWSLKYL